jgi:hypothetical protein
MIFLSRVYLPSQIFLANAEPSPSSKWHSKAHFLHFSQILGDSEDTCTQINTLFLFAGTSEMTKSLKN